MAIHPDIAAAIQHLSKFLLQDDWQARLDAHVNALLQPILADTQLDNTPDLFDALQQNGYLDTFAAYLDESLFSARFEPDGANAIDAYLQRRGWQETPRAREYLQGIRDATPAVWEVQATEPGAWIDLCDRLGDGTVVRVTERSASTMVQRYDRLVGRVIPVRDVHMVTGAVLMLTHDIADALEKALRALAKQGKPNREAVTETCLRIWIVSVLRLAKQPLPELRTTDGEPLTFGRTRLSCPPGGAAAEVEQRLDAADGNGWRRAGPDASEPSGWIWFGKGNSTILATLKADGPDAFVVETMSKARMDRALRSLKSVLGALVVPGLTTYEDATQAVARHRKSDGPATAGSTHLPDAGIEPDVVDAPEMVREVLDAHYRRTLDDKVPMLGNRTPRECARTKPGRRKLVAWLKFLENAELHRASTQGDAPYDFAWMWKELDIEAER